MKTVRRSKDSKAKAAAVSSRPKPRRAGAYVAALAVGLVFWIYWPAVYGPFLFDDEYLPFQDPKFLASHIKTILSSQRPLMNLSFWVNGALFGLNPFSYHLLNIALHLVNGLLLYLILKKLIETARPEEALSKPIAALATLLFLVHPVHTESVAYVAGRSECLSLISFLGAFLLFLKKREAGITWPSSAGILALFGAAILSKEHTAVLPALLLFTDIFFSPGAITSGLRRNWRLYAPLSTMAAFGGFFVWRVLATADTAGFAMKELPWHHYFFTQWRAIWIYIKLFFLPVGLNADYDFPISRGPLDHGAVFGLIGLIALLAVAFCYRKRCPLAFYGLVAFLVLLAPTSSVAPIKDPVAERRLYLPFLGLLLIVCEGVRRWRAPRFQQFALAGCALAALSGLTYARSTVWGNPLLLWEDTVRKSPGNSRAHFQLAMIHYTSGRCAEASKEFEQAAKTGGRDHRLLVDWGLAFDCLRQLDAALEKFREAVALDNTAHVRSLMGMVLAKKGLTGAALDELNLAERIDPNYDMTYFYRGNIYRMRQDWAKAEADYRQALRLNEQNQVAQQALAAVEKEKGGAR
jgi:hypothetical protein